LESKNNQVKALEGRMAEPAFWDDQEKAQLVISECNQLKEWTVPYADLVARFDAVNTLLPEAQKEGDAQMIAELEAELNEIEELIEELEIKRMLSGPMDKSACFLSINAGAGGTESCDWALMLSRMYQRYAENKGWKVEVIDCVDGEVAGIKNITFKFTGPFAYGYTKAEQGVHRLVRISPFDSGARRHTSFASVDVLPEISDEIVIDINPADLRIDTYRASGAGGQHVNKTDSAVRITHLPTNMMVSCQRERSQLQNKETCMKMLKSKLYEKQIQERNEQLKKIGGEKKEIAWGSQIRSYVFQPYTLVKDARTGYEVGNIQAMMDGELLDGFIIAYLKEFA
jgi:peptide chain release factor 2